jgi:hypothetical protein
MQRFSIAYRSVLPATLALILAQGCSQVHVPRNASSTAPALGEEGQAHIRGVSDPNAPFTLMDRTHAVAQQVSKQEAGQDSASMALCEPSSLQVYEAAATMNGEERSLRLAIKNNGEAACHLAGSPSISLEDQSGASIASIAIRQTGTLSLTGVVEPPMREVASTSASTAQSVDVVLPPSGEASFEIGWSSGDDCPVVSSIAIGIAPAMSSGTNAEGLPKPRFSINHSLKVCNGEVRVTSLLTGSSV